MKFEKLKKWVLRISLTLVLIITACAFFANYELKHMFGAYTGIVNNTQFDVLAKPTTITNISILSPDGTRFIENQSVSIDNGTIISIDSLNQAPTNNLIINGQGKYLIPGLIDSHVHTWQSPNDLLLYLANGVTQIRELMGSPKHLKWRQEIEDGKRLGPKMFVSSNKVQSFGLVQGWFMNWSQGNINLNKTKGTSSTIKNISIQGYDAIKLGSFLSKDIYKTLNAETNKTCLPIIGHIPLTISLKELWNSNQKEVSHIEELVKALNKEFGYYNSKNANEFLQYVAERSKDVSTNLIKNRISVVSTLGLTESFSEQKFDLDRLLGRIQLPYANPGLIEGTALTSRGLGWLPKVNLYRLPKNIDCEDKKGIKIYWHTYIKAHRMLLKTMAKYGVQILAGTDSNIPVMVPGFALHDELKSMNNAGMTSAQVLHSATSAPAECLNIKSGHILPGYVANLVLLDKNPLDNIRNTKAINTVINRGKVFDRELLDEMLASVKGANDKSRKVDIEKYMNN